MDLALRDCIFVGYRLHTGGVWTGQYEVIDFEAYSALTTGNGRTAYVHAVSEIYVPGSAGDDQEKHPAFPVAEGFFAETSAATGMYADEEPSGVLIGTMEDLTTDLA